MAGQFGWTGVDLFFVLSSYLIAAQLFQELARRHALVSPVLVGAE
ncbi:hypothetical protein [Hymenobacter terrigena]